MDATKRIDLERYPIGELGSPRAVEVIEAGRRSLAACGAAILPGFVRPEGLEELASEAMALAERAHLEDVAGTPYLALPDASYPDGHPRRTSVRSVTRVIAYDEIPRTSAARALYASDALLRFVGEILEQRPLYRMVDPLGALNLTVMEEGHVQGWHYDNTDFVVSLAIQTSRAGGEVAGAPFIRTAEDERYDAVARVLRGDPDAGVEVFPMTPGTLMLFAGRRSVHRVSPVRGEVPRIVGLFGYDTRPDTDTSDLFKLVRYGRSEAHAPPA